MDKLFITRAGVQDLEEILKLQKAAFRVEAELYNDFSIQPMNQSIEEIRQEFDQQVFLKALIGKRIIGSARAFMDEETCSINKVIVHPDFQNLGFGTRIVEEIEQIFVHARCFKISTGWKSLRNIHFYEKMGYKVVGKGKTYDNVLLVFMEKINKKNVHSR